MFKWFSSNSESTLIENEQEKPLVKNNVPVAQYCKYTRPPVSIVISTFCKPSNTVMPCKTPSNTINSASALHKMQGLESLNCNFCACSQWIFQGVMYDSYVSRLYAERDGCIPSNVSIANSKFLIPWRYKNKKTSQISWKIYHLNDEFVDGPESEVIVVDPSRDTKLSTILSFAKSKCAEMPIDKELVEFLLKIVRKAMGDYGIQGGPTSLEADATLFNKMQTQGHNFVLLGTVAIGVCRHKALLFKLLCDTVGVECSLVTGYSTSGRHQWNIVTLPEKGHFLVDATSKHFTWAKPGSIRTKGYKIDFESSLGHAGFTIKDKGII